MISLSIIFTFVCLEIAFQWKLPMELRERISWQIGYVQKTLLFHLDEYFDIPLSEHGQRLIAILEIVEVKKMSFLGWQLNGLVANCLPGS